MECPIKQEQVSIVFVGSLNPAIFQPAWFAARDLIASDADKNAVGVKLNLVHPEITDFSTDNFHLQVVPQRLAMITAKATFYDSLRDLALGTLRILQHTPVAKMGINRGFHFQMPSVEAWNNVGDRLAPKEEWRRVIKEPGLIALTIQGKRDDSYKGYIQVRVGPSPSFQNGVAVDVNDHFEVADLDTLEGCSELTDILAAVWRDSLDRAASIARAIVLGETGEERP